jgi:hypothetical protein
MSLNLGVVLVKKVKLGTKKKEIKKHINVYLKFKMYILGNIVKKNHQLY